MLLAAAIATFACIIAYAAYYIRFRWSHSAQGAMEVSLLTLIALLALMLALQVGAAAIGFLKNR